MGKPIMSVVKFGFVFLKKEIFKWLIPAQRLNSTGLLARRALSAGASLFLRDSLRLLLFPLTLDGFLTWFAVIL